MTRATKEFEKIRSRKDAKWEWRKVHPDFERWTERRIYLYLKKYIFNDRSGPHKEMLLHELAALERLVLDWKLIAKEKMATGEVEKAMSIRTTKIPSTDAKIHRTIRMLLNCVDVGEIENDTKSKADYTLKFKQPDG